MASRRKTSRGQLGSWLQYLSCWHWKPEEIDMLELSPAPPDSKPKTEQPQLPVKFQWGHGGDVVALLGLWEELTESEENTSPPPPQWTEVSMNKSPSGEFVAQVKLSEGIYPYTFVVDDVITFDKDKPIGVINGCRRNVLKLTRHKDK